MYPRKMSELMLAIYEYDWGSDDLEAGKLYDFYTDLVVAIKTNGEVDNNLEIAARSYHIYTGAEEDMTTEGIFNYIHAAFWDYIESGGQ